MLTHQESPAVNTVLRNYVILFPAPKDTALPWAFSMRSWYGVILTHPSGIGPGGSGVPDVSYIISLSTVWAGHKL